VVRASGRFDFARVQAQLEQQAEALADVGRLSAEIGFPTQHLDRVVVPAPAVAALVALGLAERPEPLHSPRSLGQGPDNTGTLRAMATVSPRVLEFDVSVDRDRTAHSRLGGSAIPLEDEWWAEHLVLAGLVRCTLASMDYTAHRAGFEVVGAGEAHGTVTKREDDGRYAFVEVESHLEIELEPAPAAKVVRELIERAERGCFVGNSLTAEPRYRWTVNGAEIE